MNKRLTQHVERIELHQLSCGPEFDPDECQTASGRYHADFARSRDHLRGAHELLHAGAARISADICKCFHCKPVHLATRGEQEVARLVMDRKASCG